jgi:hypothetical protein
MPQPTTLPRAPLLRVYGHIIRSLHRTFTNRDASCGECEGLSLRGANVFLPEVGQNSVCNEYGLYLPWSLQHNI